MCLVICECVYIPFNLKKILNAFSRLFTLVEASKKHRARNEKLFPTLKTMKMKLCTQQPGVKCAQNPIIKKAREEKTTKFPDNFSLQKSFCFYGSFLSRDIHSRCCWKIFNIYCAQLGLKFNKTLHNLQLLNCKAINHGQLGKPIRLNENHLGKKAKSIIKSIKREGEKSSLGDVCGREASRRKIELTLVCY